MEQMFFFEPSSLKILLSNLQTIFHILLTTIWPTNGENIGKLLVAKFHLKIAKCAYSLAQRFFLAIFNCKFN